MIYPQVVPVLDALPNSCFGERMKVRSTGCISRFSLFCSDLEAREKQASSACFMQGSRAKYTNKMQFFLASWL